MAVRSKLGTKSLFSAKSLSLTLKPCMDPFRYLLIILYKVILTLESMDKTRLP